VKNPEYLYLNLNAVYFIKSIFETQETSISINQFKDPIQKENSNKILFIAENINELNLNATLLILDNLEKHIFTNK
jgi:hypothetical protein